MQPAGHVDDRAVVEKRRHRARVDRRRHDDDPQVVARAPRLPRQRDREIGVDAALVELVEDDGGEVGEQRIALQPRGQDAFGDDEQPRVGAEAAVETHLPADLAADRPAALLGDARGNRPRGDAARLQQDERTVGGERRRNPRRLAGAGRGGDDRGARPPDAVDDLPEEVIDRKRTPSSWRSGSRSDAHRTAHAGAAEAAVAVGVLREVLLVVVLGVVELGRRQDLGGDRRRSPRRRAASGTRRASSRRRASAPRRSSRCRSGTACRRRCPAACPASDRGSPRTPSAARS